MMVLHLAVASILIVDAVQAVKLIINAKVYTVNPEQPWATAIAIGDDGIIVGVGQDDQILQQVYDSPISETIDMGGRLVLPGFQDSHVHVVEAGIFALACEFDAYPMVEDIPFYFDDCPGGGEFGDQGWLLGSGVDISYLLEAVMFGAEYPLTVLDRVYPDTPVLILDNLGHGAIANTAAMTAVGYDQIITDPPGGKVLRDKNDFLLGIVLENAQQPLRDAAFPPTEANQQTAYESLLEALEVLAANGITSVSDAGGFWRQAQIEAWGRAEREGLLTVRASNALYVYPDHTFDEQLPQLLSRFSNDSTKLVRFNQAKVYVDGILSLGTAALKTPYTDALPYSLFTGVLAEADVGFEYFADYATLESISSLLVQNGFQLHFHVTGDRGAALALDVIEAIGSNQFGPHRLTHCYLVDQADWNRFAELGVVADFQAAPSSFSDNYTTFLGEIIGQIRSSQLIPALELYESGALVVLSSDWDADEISPLVKIETVLSRPDGRSFPDVETVIPLMTTNPAKLLHNNAGKIEEGKDADIVALDQDIFSIQSESIGETRVVFTMFNGDVIYDPTGISGTRVLTSAAPSLWLYTYSTSSILSVAGLVMFLLCHE